MSGKKDRMSEKRKDEDGFHGLKRKSGGLQGYGRGRAREGKRGTRMNVEAAEEGI